MTRRLLACQLSLLGVSCLSLVTSLGLVFSAGPAPILYLPQPVNRAAKANAAVDEQVVAGVVLSFTAPAALTLREHAFNEGPFAEKIVLVAASSEGVVRVSLTTQTVPEGGLSEASGVRFRRDRPATYREETEYIIGVPALVFTRQADHFEQVAFLEKNGFVVTLAARSKSFIGQELARQYYQEISNRVEWREP